MNINDIMTQAKVELLMTQPFFGTIFFSHTLEEDNTIPTFAVDSKFNIKYNTEFVKNMHKQNKDYVVFCLAHELAHTIMLTFTRGVGKDKLAVTEQGQVITVWNLATDYANNLILKDCGFVVPAGALLDEKYRGMSAEQIYDLLCEEIEKNSDGSIGADLSKVMIDIDQNDQGNSLTEAEKNKIEHEVKIMTSGAVNSAKRGNRWGNMPDSFKRTIDAFLNPKMSWKDVLPNVVMNNVSRDDYTWKRYSRNYLASTGYILPSLYNQTRGKVICAIDTSGSITQNDLTIYATEIRSLMQQVRPSEVVVVYCDADVNHVDTFVNYDDLEFNMHGGGGTRFSPVFDYVNNNHEEVECLIYFTDMYCDDFGECGDYPVVWLSTTNGVRDVPFGTVVEYNDK